MSMVCPQCQGSFSQRLQCPSCGVRLEYRTSARPTRVDPLPASAWQQTPWGRILIGLLLAQGLYYGLWNLGKAGLLALDPETGQTFWATLSGLLLLQGLQAFGLLLGGGLTGAGQRQGALHGGLVGICNGVISVWMMYQGAAPLSPVLVYGQPLLHTAFGAAGGLVGSLIWRPLPVLGEPVAGGSGLRLRMFLPRNLFAGPLAWGRVLIGTALALGGTIWANFILDMMLAAGEGKLAIDSDLEARLVTWEITALALLVGSALAGATTVNGFKQGLCVGLATAALLVGFQVGSRHPHLDSIGLTLAGTLILCTFGGWFGKQLLPPIPAHARRKRLGPVL